MTFSLIRSSTHSVIFLFLVQRERHFYKWRFPFKCKCHLENGNLYSVFRAFVCLLLLKCNQIKIIFMKKRYILAQQMLLHLKLNSLFFLQHQVVPAYFMYFFYLYNNTGIQYLPCSSMFYLNFNLHVVIFLLLWPIKQII